MLWGIIQGERDRGGRVTIKFHVGCSEGCFHKARIEQHLKEVRECAPKIWGESQLDREG